MPDYESFGETLKTFFVSATRIVLYPPLLVLRVLARLLLLAATVLPVTVPFLAGVVLLELWQEWDIGTKIADWLEEDQALLTGLAYFVAVGLFANFLKSIVNLFWAAVKGVLRSLRDVFLGADADGNGDPRGREWIPSAKVGNSLAVTWRDNIVQIPHNLTLAVGRTALLTAAAAVGAAVVAVTIPFVLRDTKVDRYVWVTVAEPRGDASGHAEESQQETDTQDAGVQEGGGPSIEAPEATTPSEPAAPPRIGTQPVLEAHLRNGTVFSLTHLKDAQPKRGEGICLNRSQQAWLREFRTAIAACVGAESTNRDDAPVRQFDVTAFASVAPVESSESSGITPGELNCEIANRRADAVGAFLADETKHESKWDCDSVAADFRAATSHCAASSRPYHDYDASAHYGVKFKVRVHQWRSSSDLEIGKPVDDGALPGDRRYAVEMLNRSVHITVPRDFCRPSKSEQSEGQSTADATAGAEVPTESSNEQE